METYLLKFSACLFVFWLVYVLFLERQNMHRLKRFYLLSVLILALVIPTLTITEYIEPVIATSETAPVFFPMELVLEDVTIEEAPFFNLETTLWLIYGFGVLMFASRFIVNLIKMQRRISKNDNIKKRSFIYVLLHENTIPHSFFRYIFFNKTRYESDNIPKEVLLHEETHARQLHSLDIIILEVLQVIFWFHPLIYILKHHVKLNHEFLADQAVLEQGTDTKVYQHILLQFSSNTQNHQLSSAINYSSIKKRFTVMKTQTSKTRVWLSTVLVLPIIAILFYSFAERVEVIQEKEKLQNNSIVAQEKPLTEKEISAYNAWAKKIHSESTKLSDDATFYPPINEQDFIKFSEIYKRMSTQQEDQSIEFPFPGLVVKDSEQEKATAKQVEEYNAWAKKINTAMAKASANNGKIKEYPIVKQRDLDKYKHIYNIMTDEQKKTAAAFPQGPPPPPPAKPQNTTTIKPVEILIKKDNSIILNDMPVEFADLANVAIKINKDLTIEERRDFAFASVLIEYNDSLSFAQKVQEELRNADIWSSSIGYLENQEKSGLPSKHFNLYAGLTLEEAKIEKEKSLKEYKNRDTIVKSPWKVTMGSATYIEPKDTQLKQGPIEINGVNYYFTQQNGKTTYFDKYGKTVDINKIPPPPPIPNNATPEQEAKMKKATDAYMKANPDKVGTATTTEGEVLEVIEIPDDLQGTIAINGETFYYTTSHGKTTYYNSYGTEVKMDNLPPPPPAPESTLDFIIRMAKTNAKFFNEGKSISSDKAIDLLKKNPKLNVNAQKTDTKEPLIYISKKPILIGVNGKIGEQN
ncbi:Regulatory sensor-transducer, BlaR1/MecR1 family [Winogradskyella psychrotolerans RS-3]|uniref:Regulatory sensor-transducer, BlaR1/MecR1 family n=1 Tax=Winogradskyella psychrotolerans RS-3 TaxID=641526 RepID=S7XBI1_9FLAO|nr:M56 family metallopeptidase [Winogradskyella psychrotolerans]EPR73358.1 Regulatory sensor-transducer, BlaR1/MecR1 family [Winogradskyella psychrotolerans RS-3]